MNNGKHQHGWSVKPLGEAAVVTMGSSPPGESYNDEGRGVPLINGPVEFSEGDFGLTVRGKSTTEPTRMCKPGDLLLCVRGSTTGRTNIAGFDACIGRGVASIRAKDDQRFLNHFIRTQRKRLFDLGNGSTFPSITQEQLVSVQVPLPPLSEQRRIAAILDKADAIRRKREEGIRLTEELLRSTFLEMFGDPATNIKGWEMRPFGELARNEDGRRKPVKESDRADRHGDYPYYGASGIIDYVDEFLFDERTLLIAEDGANLLARATPIAFIADGKYWVNNHAHVVSDNGKADLDYLRFSLNLRKLDDFVTGSAQPKLNQASLNRIPIPLPPLSDQRKFANAVRKLNELKDHRQAAVNEATNLFGSLVQRAFRGEL
jgi:type I restriction enzyme S subunit